MPETNKEDVQAQLRSSIFLMVSKIVEEETKKLDVHATPMFIASLVELTMNQLLNVGEDLELFANHAGRTSINADDFYMVVRKNDVLTGILKEYENKLDN